MGVNALTLEILDYVSPTKWTWRLLGPSGTFLADHEVDLDATSSGHLAFVDLDGFLRSHRDTSDRVASESRLVESAGRWIATEVFGDAMPAIVAYAPATVHVRLPPGGTHLATRPFELAWDEEGPLALRDVSFIISSGSASPPHDPVASELRILALFSQPADAAALGLRRERYELERLVAEVSTVHRRSVQLRVLQYGVTRERLAEVLRDGAGWDILHFSGHGLPGGLALERDDGSQDLVDAGDLLRFLRPARGRLKVVVLSSCLSGATVALDTLRTIGVDASPDRSGSTVDLQPRSTLAIELSNGLGCAVLAMRYPVADGFAIRFAGELYRMLLVSGQELPRAVHLALQLSVDWPATSDSPPISIATPSIVGWAANSVGLAAPVGGRGVAFDETELGRVASLPPEPTRFVGRVAALARSSAALAPRSGKAGVLFCGMAGAGKTAIGLELAYGHAHAFDAIAFFKCPDEGGDISVALVSFAMSLEAAIPGLQLVHRLDSPDDLDRFWPVLAEYFESRRVLVVLDNIESLLTSTGRWRDERWSDLVKALSPDGGLGRLVMTSRTVPIDLPRGIQQEPVGALSRDEAVLLARELPGLRSLLEGTSALKVGDGRRLLTRTLASVQGHPELMRLADAQVSDPAALRQMLDRTEAEWGPDRALLDDFLTIGGGPDGTERYQTILEGWARSVIGSLSEQENVLFSLLCCLQEGDRRSFVAEPIWGLLPRVKELDRPGVGLQIVDDAGLEKPSLEGDPALGALLRAALVEVSTDPLGGGWSLRLHPVIAAVGQSGADPKFVRHVRFAAASFWMSLFIAGRRADVEEDGRLIALSGMSAAPYLMSLEDWSSAANVLRSAITRDPSAASLAAALPLLRRIAEKTAGTPGEAECRMIWAGALAGIDPDTAEAHLSELLSDLERDGNFEMAFAVAGDLSRILRMSGRITAAKALTERTFHFANEAKLGPLATLAVEVRLLQIESSLGRYEEVLEQYAGLRERLELLSEEGADSEAPVSLWNVRETLVDTAHTSALYLGQWNLSLELNAETIESAQQRGAGRRATGRPNVQ